MSDIIQNKIPPEAEKDLLAMRARGIGSQTLANWLKAKHGVVVARQSVDHWLQRRQVAGAIVAPSLYKPSEAPELDDLSLCDAILRSELENWRQSVTLPERRAAQSEMRKTMELRRGIAKSQDDTKEAKREAFERELMARLDKLASREPIQVLEVHPVEPHVEPAPPGEPSK